MVKKTQLFFWKYFSIRKKCYFSMGFFLKSISWFRRIVLKRFPIDSDSLKVSKLVLDFLGLFLLWPLVRHIFDFLKFRSYNLKVNSKIFKWPKIWSKKIVFKKKVFFSTAGGMNYLSLIFERNRRRSDFSECKQSTNANCSKMSTECCNPGGSNQVPRISANPRTESVLYRGSMKLGSYTVPR